MGSHFGRPWCFVDPWNQYRSAERNETHTCDGVSTQISHTTKNAIQIIAQESLVGHPKGGWQTTGLLRSVNTGITPGNRNNKFQRQIPLIHPPHVPLEADLHRRNPSWRRGALRLCPHWWHCACATSTPCHDQIGICFSPVAIVSSLPRSISVIFQSLVRELNLVNFDPRERGIDFREFPFWCGLEGLGCWVLEVTTEVPISSVLRFLVTAVGPFTFCGGLTAGVSTVLARFVFHGLPLPCIIFSLALEVPSESGSESDVKLESSDDNDPPEDRSHYRQKSCW